VTAEVESPVAGQGRHAWIDASAGIAGDMLLGALVDAGAELAAVQRAVEAVIPGSVRLVEERVTRAGIAGRKVDVEVLVEDPPHRTWTTIRRMLEEADLAPRVRRDALAVFERLAEAEGRVHGVPADDIHFHEVGALDSIADVVGVCAALHDLGVVTLTAGEVAVGSGHVRAAHGKIPVPVPAVTQLAGGWRITAGGQGELTTPTGMALLAALCLECADLPAMTLDRVGVGAGTKDFPGRANVTRVVIGSRVSSGSGQDGDPAVLLEANIDDLDPRLWPGVLAQLMEHGASDAWLVPILMKKGRPAHTLSVLCHPRDADRLRDAILVGTTTIGVRQHPVAKFALPRAWVDVPVDGGTVAVKLAHRDGVILQATPEFDEVAAIAAGSGRPQHVVLAEATASAATSGLLAGGPVPSSARSVRS
jgi:pyridinium-3,5-bisthiocarboxylic acid mononucleotide nickel chelatase